MRIEIAQDSLEVSLARWQKILGLMRDISVPLADIRGVEVVEDAVREAMGSGIKVGLRLPWLCYVARTIRLDEAFVVRRGVPGLSVEVSGGTLRRLLVSTPEAAALAAQLSRHA